MPVLVSMNMQNCYDCDGYKEDDGVVHYENKNSSSLLY